MHLVKIMEIFSIKRKRPTWKLGTALIICSALFSYFTYIAFGYLGVNPNEKVAEYSAGYMSAFILGAAFLFGLTYLLSYFIVHVSEYVFKRVL